MIRRAIFICGMHFVLVAFLQTQSTAQDAAVNKELNQCLENLAALKTQLGDDQCFVPTLESSKKFAEVVATSGTCTKAGLDILKAPNGWAKMFGGIVLFGCKAKTIYNSIDFAKTHSGSVKECDEIKGIIEKNAEICKDKKLIVVTATDEKSGKELFQIVSLEDMKVIASYPMLAE